jgi:drug/metabolite transporter (DMT)-like permease
MKKTPLKAILLVVLCTFLSTAGQFCLKNAMQQSYPQLLWTATLYVGLAFYAIATAILIIALQLGELSALYPIASLSLVWVMLVSATLLREPIGIAHVAGATLIIAGISLLGDNQPKGRRDSRRAA